VLRQPLECRGLSTPHIISLRLVIRPGADAGQRAAVRRALRIALWTDEADGKIPLVEVLPALCAGLGVRVESDPPVPADWRCPMVTRNMRLSAALNDLARRMNVRLTLSHNDPFSKASRVQTAKLEETFGGEDGVAEIVVTRPDGRGRIDMFARVQPDSCLDARLFQDNSRFLAPEGIDDTGAGEMYHKMSARLTPGTKVRLAVVGVGCALNVGNKWLLLNRMPSSLTKGGFQVRVVSDWVKVGDIRYVAADEHGS